MARTRLASLILVRSRERLRTDVPTDSCLIYWDGANSNCASAWHPDKYSTRHVVLISSAYDPSASGSDRMIFLKPSRGTVSIKQTFKDISLPDASLGCWLSVRMGRLDCTTTWFSVRISATTTLAAEKGSWVTKRILYKSLIQGRPCRQASRTRW